jgi:hypothetical protein
VLSRRHASVYNEAIQAFREQWSVEEPEEANHSGAGGENTAPSGSPTDVQSDIDM